MTVLAGEPWIRTAILGILLLVVLAPMFGWAADAVGYEEPLENAAEATGATDEATRHLAGLLPGYAVPGIRPPVEPILAAALGSFLTFTAAGGIGRLHER
ncbi:MAG: PDGLE domain-containing protein [Halodesulfurarchaeum sp.]